MIAIKGMFNKMFVTQINSFFLSKVLFFFPEGNYCNLKVPLWSNSRYPRFYIFRHNRSFLDFLPNFNLLRTLELAVFGPLFLRIYGRHKFSLFQVLAEIWRKWHQILKNTTRAEIRVTRKHWPPVRAPPLRTGSTDYLRTGPRTTLMDALRTTPKIE